MEEILNTDCCFTREGNWFRYRATAIIIEDGCVLMAGNESADYLYSVGGGVHMGETSEEAVLREVLEETGVRYEIDRLAFIHENFFSGGYSLEGLNCHEIAFYYLMKPRGSQELNSDSSCPDGKEYMKWIPIGDLKTYKAYPAFFADRLTKMSRAVEHIVTIEERGHI